MCHLRAKRASARKISAGRLFAALIPIVSITRFLANFFGTKGKTNGYGFVGLFWGFTPAKLQGRKPLNIDPQLLFWSIITQYQYPFIPHLHLFVLSTKIQSALGVARVQGRSSPLKTGRCSS